MLPPPVQGGCLCNRKVLERMDGADELRKGIPLGGWLTR